MSGQNVCGWGTGATFEQHITGDVAMAARLYYYFTKSDTWLKQHGWPVIKGAAVWQLRHHHGHFDIILTGSQPCFSATYHTPTLTRRVACSTSCHNNHP